ncbi:hypothetical protein FRB94_009375 [Tulasnella sp. JGI-2019a]|nr:hypothetical protein FRB94_009375 [Tulasnella sp. JGI-2019a]KAG9026235.1 hypothetical protein FRB95_009073 [Tulasnella sp. JGI-2019a]
MSSSKYDSLRKQSRTLEGLVETKLSTYAKLASSVTRTAPDLEAGTADSQRFRDLGNDLEELLEKLRDTNDQMSTLVNDQANPPTSTMLHALQRQRDVMQDYNREFARTKANAQAALDKANLLDNVRSDINSYKAAQSSVTDSLLGERGRIDSSHRMIDETLDQAYATRSEFSNQRTTLAGINTRMGGVLNTLPGINSLLGMIHSRRRRDSIIIGCLIGALLLFLFWYITG